MPLEMLFSSHDVKRKVSQGYGCSAVAGRLGRVPVPEGAVHMTIELALRELVFSIGLGRAKLY